MPVLYNTNFLVGLNNQLYDLGNILYNYSSNTVQISATGTTFAVASINYDRPTIILETDITATMDGYPANGDQVFTFGPAVQPRTAILGQGNNGAAFSNDGINIFPLGVSNVVSNLASAVFWDGFKWVGNIIKTFNTTPSNVISYDGIWWIYLSTTSLPSGTGFAWKVIYNGQIYVIAGGGGGLATGYSFDGINWIVATGPASGASFYALGYNGVAWLLGGSTSPYLYFSLNGISWTAATHSFTTVQDVAWMGDKWVACGIVGTSRVAYTFDRTGATGWTTATSSTIFGSNATRLCWNGKILIIQSNGTNTLGYSYNGIDWVGLGTTIFPTLTWGNLSWNGKSFLAGGGSNTNGLAYSFNGINWVGLGLTVIGAPYNITYNTRRPHSITYQRNLTIAGGNNGAINTIAYSLDGITWVGLGNTIFTTQGLGSAYNGRLWVMGGQGTNTLAFSRNGITWRGLGTSIFTGYGLNVVWNPYLSLWVASGNGTNTMAWSNDGLTWIPGTNIFPNAGYGIAYTSSLMVAVGWNTAGSGNTFAYSINGKNWIGLGNPVITSNGYGIATNGTLWVAVGLASTTVKIAYSYNGINWFDTGYSTAGSCWNIAWNGSMWVAGIGGASMAYSYNGINWTAGTNVFSAGGAGVCWNGTMWVAAGQGTNNLAYSYNGINWTGVTGATIFATNGYWVSSNYQVPPKAFIQHPTLAFGAGGNSISYSPDGLSWIGLGRTVFSTSGIAGAWNGKMWVGCGSGGNTMAYSYDGVNWTGLGSSLFSTSCHYISCNENIWVAVGHTSTNGIIAYSYNGVNWNIGYSEAYATNYPGSVAWNGTHFLAVLNLTSTSVPNLYNSTNGITWTKLTPTGTFATRAGRGLISNGILWIMATFTNGVYYTSDRTGITGWTLASTTTGLSMRYFSWNGVIWVAAASQGIYYSSDGMTWVSTGITLDCASVCWNGTRFVLVANITYDLRYSYDGITWYSQQFIALNGYVVSNSGVGAFAPPSAMVLNNYGISGNSIANSQTLEIVSSDPFYQMGFNTMSVKVECNNIYM